MNDLLKWLSRTVLTAVVWVFVLSVNVEGRTLFSYANEILVQNSVVRMVDEELSELWDKVYVTAKKAAEESESRGATEAF